ncbi:MAG: type II toxin-antitoxin system VapC family toxin [Candidatus Anammoximicrobium sp.]|nr:type II toxin-antitoxin system VapC family toxin [Candidatus Anammoximicrobium sp.]
MTTLFADTSFFVAYLSDRDEAHAWAVEYMTHSTDRIQTSEWILAELGNYLAEGRNRRLFGPLVRALYDESRFEIAGADSIPFLEAFELYVRRADKGWSFTDCTSFRLMKARRITDALTTDQHFAEAGFRVLLTAK